MKMLSSSPYAIFNAKEWNCLSKVSYNYNFDNSSKFNKKYFKSYKKFDSKDSSEKDFEKKEIIQLSFA